MLTYLSNKSKIVNIQITHEFAIDCNLNAFEWLLAGFFNDFLPTLRILQCQNSFQVTLIAFSRIKVLIDEYKHVKMQITLQLVPKRNLNAFE